MKSGDIRTTLRVTRIILRGDVCLAHECCIPICPQVFTFRDGGVALAENAADYYVSEAHRIVEVRAWCPVDAIVVETDPPTPRERPASDSAAGKKPAKPYGGHGTLREALKHARRQRDPLWDPELDG